MTFITNPAETEKTMTSVTSLPGDHLDTANAEAARLLRLGGRCGIHELCLVPDELSREKRDLIEHDLSTTIRVGARPLTIPEWHALLTETWLQHNPLCHRRPCIC